MGMSSCRLVGRAMSLYDAPAGVGWLRRLRPRLHASHAALHALPELHHVPLRQRRESRRVRRPLF